MLIMPLRNESHTEAIDRSRPQFGTHKGDRGSWPEPGERVTLLSVFREGCEEWYKHHRHDEPCDPARQAVLMTLADRYDAEQLARWRGNIKIILDRAEAEIMEVEQ